MIPIKKITVGWYLATCDSRKPRPIEVIDARQFCEELKMKILVVADQGEKYRYLDRWEFFQQLEIPPFKWDENNKCWTSEPLLKTTVSR